MPTPNQNPEQQARDNIDDQLQQAGWSVQDKDKINWKAGPGVAVRHYLTQAGKEADYVLFLGPGQPAGIIEAKKEEEGHHLTVVEEQSGEYAASKLKYLDNDPLPFVYESTGTLTRFTDGRDPKPRSRPVFTFHRPESFAEWSKQDKSLRARLLDLPALPTARLRDCQITAITNLENSFKQNRPRALIQMATGSGKTFTAITAIYRLLKYANAGRVLFLVDTKNLGEQAEQEFMGYIPSDDNRTFTELYGVHRLRSRHIPTNNHVYISTIQRLYAILKGEELDERLEEENPAERDWQAKEPLPVVYNPAIPIEFFDFIVVDECHRSIYNLWKQVLDYFDSFLIGLTATPDKRTFAFFNENVVSEYSHEQAVTDGVNVPGTVYRIETAITKKGAVIWRGEVVDKREKLTRKTRWEQLDEDVPYRGSQLDRSVVNLSQIRNVIRTFRDRLPEIFPGRRHVPKTLIFAKTDSHADDIIQIVREEFGEGNDFCKKVTYNAKEDAKSVLSQFRTQYHPRLAVTVDMIATGTDVKPLECLLFMRDVKSRNYFEQMKGRGTRTLGHDDMLQVTPDAASAKTHYVIVDAVGVTQSLKTDSRPLERQPNVPLKELLAALTFGAANEDLFSSLANRLVRLDRQLNDDEQAQVAQLAGGLSLSRIARALLEAYDPDAIEAVARRHFDPPEGAPPGWSPDPGQLAAAQQRLIEQAAAPFSSYELADYVEKARRQHEQIMDTLNLDTVQSAGWDSQARRQAESVVGDFRTFCALHQDELLALRIFYQQPLRRREVTFHMVKAVLERLKVERPALAPAFVWQAYEQLEQVNGRSPKDELVALVSLIRRVTQLDEVLTPFDQIVDRNFKQWVFQKNAGADHFTAEQMAWLRMIKEHIAASIHFDRDDLEYAPFDAQGGPGKMWQLFGDEMETVIAEMNEALAA
jgi:type I restriction enzyme R subunit